MAVMNIVSETILVVIRETINYFTSSVRSIIVITEIYIMMNEIIIIMIMMTRCASARK